jgi:hypothetical protein
MRSPAGEGGTDGAVAEQSASGWDLCAGLQNAGGEAMVPPIKKPRSTGVASGVQSQGDVGQEEEEPAPCRSSTVSAFRRVASHEPVSLSQLRSQLMNARQRWPEIHGRQAGIDGLFCGRDFRAICFFRGMTLGGSG